MKPGLRYTLTDSTAENKRGWGSAAVCVRVIVNTIFADSRYTTISDRVCHGDINIRF